MSMKVHCGRVRGGWGWAGAGGMFVGGYRNLSEVIGLVLISSD